MGSDCFVDMLAPSLLIALSILPIAWAKVNEVWCGAINAYNEPDTAGIFFDHARIGIGFHDDIEDSIRINFVQLLWTVTVKAAASSAVVFTVNGPAGTQHVSTGSPEDALIGYAVWNLLPDAEYIVTAEAVDHGEQFTSESTFRTKAAPICDQQADKWDASKCGHLGVNIHTELTVETLQCLKAHHHDFIIGRGFHSNGHIDQTICPNMLTAGQAAVDVRGIYFYPKICGRVVSASSQLSELKDHLQANCPEVAAGQRIWIEIIDQLNWGSDFAANRKHYEQMVDACAQLKLTCGIYSTAAHWAAIFGDSKYFYGDVRSLPLWYSNSDHNANTFDYRDAGIAGWPRPMVKQFEQDATLCDVMVDRNLWRP